MSSVRQLLVTMDPPVLLLDETGPRLVHDVGEIVEVRMAAATLTAVIRGADALTHEPVNALVHLPGRTLPANTPFTHRFVSEYNEQLQEWSRETIWVESAGYENGDLAYGIEVRPAPPVS